MNEARDRFFRRGGLALVVVVLGGLGLARSVSYYGTPLRGFDAQFYYAAARSAVVSGDWDVTDDLPLSPAQAPFRTDAGVPQRPDGGAKNVFPVGLSLVEAVLLLPVRGLSAALNPGAGPPGYTRLEVCWVAFGLLLGAAVGLQVVYSFARTLVSPWPAAGVTLLAYLGTPLLYYTTWFPFSVHPTTFVIMVLLLLVADRLPRTTRPNAAVFAFGVLAALLYLTRPHQTPYAVLLVAWRLPPLLRQGYRVWLPGAVAGLVVCAAAIGFQMAVHGLNTGTPALIAHGEHDHPMISGHFVFPPQFAFVLTAPTRGLFWITPIVPLALVGFAVRWRAVPWWGWASLINAALQTAILACWSDPGQGDSFGIRLWAEHVPVVVCGLALLMKGPENGRRPVRVLWGAAACACVCWTMLVCVCYVRGELRSESTHGEVLSRCFRR